MNVLFPYLGYKLYAKLGKGFLIPVPIHFSLAIPVCLVLNNPPNVTRENPILVSYFGNQTTILGQS